MTTAKTNNALSALLLFLLLMTINGCEQETEKEIDSWRKNQTEKTLSDIEFAKKWYQNNVQSGKILLQTDSPTLRASGDTAFFFTNPTWKYYAVNQNGKIKAVDVDLTDSIYTEFVPEENDKAYEETKDWKYRRSYSRMTILQSLQTQQTIGFIMTIIPSPRYVDNRYDRIRFITYLNREPDFDGIILFHNIDGSFSNGWIYENGKVSKRIIEHDADCINNNPSLSINLFKVKYSVRVKEESQDNFRSGEETYDGGTLPEVECVAPYIKRKGYTTYDYIYYIENQNNSGIQHQVWWMQEDNLYEGGGGYGPPSVELNDNLKTLFKGKNNLSEEDTKKLNKAYDEMRKKCLYEFIDNYLRQNDVQLRNINMNPNYGGQAGINNLGDLTFWNSENINSENLSHEWIHLFQKEYHNMTLFGDDVGMMEFEVALIQDILMFIEVGGNINKALYSWACFAMGKYEHQKAYENWLKEMTNNGTRYPSSIDTNKFLFFSNVFGDVSIPYNKNRGYIYGNAAYGTSAIQALFNQANRHCNK